MTDLRFDDPCILFPMRRESRPFRMLFPANQGFPGAPCWAKFCGPAWLSVLVLETGVGAKRTQAALDWLESGPKLDHVIYRPKLVLSAGFCGGLRDDLQIGDVVLATEIVDAKDQRWPTTWPATLPPGPWSPPLHLGRVVTSPELLADSVQRQRLFEQTSALAVDMESAIVARWSLERGIPFGCVRAVSDDARAAISPTLAYLVASGRVSPWRLLATLARRPFLLSEMWRLARSTRHAGKQLALALGELLTLTLPWLDQGREVQPGFA